MARAISEAREHGDLKENAEYHAAKDKQGLSEARIAFIQDRLKNAQVIDIAKIGKRDTVVFGATVTIYNEDEERTIKAQIVGEEEANLGARKIPLPALSLELVSEKWSVTRLKSKHQMVSKTTKLCRLNIYKFT